VNRATSVPCQGKGVAKVPATAAAGAVLLPPTDAVLIQPKPPVVLPAALRVCVAKALVLEKQYPRTGV